MAKFNLHRARTHLQKFAFQSLFIEELGWEYPPSEKPDTLTVDDRTYTRRPIAQLGGVMVYELIIQNDALPNQQARRKVHTQISQEAFEHLLIFTAYEDKQPVQTIWSWEKREQGKRYTRSHTFARGQTGDLFLSKIAPMFVDLSDLDAEGHISVAKVAGRLRDALDVERVTKKFFDQFQLTHTLFLQNIQGIDHQQERRWYTSVVLNRLMFTYFLQKKGFLDRSNLNYLREKLTQSQTQGQNQYYHQFLQPLFFDGFGTPESERSPQTVAKLGHIKYLNGGLFLPHPIEEKYGSAINIPDDAFDTLFNVFDSYSWNLDDTPGGQDDEINPDVLGYIFEKYINQKEFGAYYTRPEITEYLCEQTIHKLVLDKLQAFNLPLPNQAPPPTINSLEDMYRNLDALRCQQLLHDILPSLSLLDPACGSGAFLVAALKTMQNLYEAVLGRIPFLKDRALQQWYDKTQASHPSLGYFIKKQIITQNLYGVDIMAEAVEIARLRLFLALVATAQQVDDLEPLPNIDFNILSGNSLIGLLRVDDATFNRHIPAKQAQPVDGTQLGMLPDHATQLGLFSAGRTASYREIVAEKNRLVRIYQQTTSLTDDLQALRDNILAHRQQANATLNQMLLDEFQELGIMFEQATWNSKKNKEGQAKKRPLTIADIQDLSPFHWGYEFDRIMNESGGFDAIIANPPWEVFQTDDKEFFSEYSDIVYKRKMNILDFTKHKGGLLGDPIIREAWLDYSSKFTHQNRYFKKANQYANQGSGKQNLYKLFIEQCFNLQRSGGICGIVVPASFYIDRDKKQLRSLFFEKTQITGLFCFENKGIFEGVDSRFKFILLTFKKGEPTRKFPAAFVRTDTSELQDFPNDRDISISVDMIRRSSPDLLSIYEFKSQLEVEIIEKLSLHSTIGDTIEDGWNIRLTTGFDKTANKDLFELEPSIENYPLYSGSTVHYYNHNFSEPQYYINSDKGKQRQSGRLGYKNGQFACEYYRLIQRRITGQTNQRSLISTVIPKYSFCDNSVNYVIPGTYTYRELMFISTIFSSFIADYFVRQQVNTNITIGVVNQLPVPRLTEADPVFAPIVERAARLICTTPEFDELAQAVGLGSHQDGVTDETERAKLRAELDGMIAHIYGLTDAEFQHILSTFPLVDAEVKQAAMEAYRHLAPNPEIMVLIDMGEGQHIEFKESLRRNPYTGKDGKQKMSHNVVEAVAGMMNHSAGGWVFIGISDAGEIKGIEQEYPIINQQKANWDGFALYLAGLLRNSLSLSNPGQYYELVAHTLHGKTIASLKVSPAPEPAYFNDKLYLRSGPETIELNGPDLVAYVNERWG